LIPAVFASIIQKRMLCEWLIPSEIGEQTLGGVMWFKRMMLEDWFDTHQYEVEYDVGESAVKYLTFDELGIDLGKLPLRYGYHLGLPDLREIIAGQYDGLSPEHIIVTCGASEANFATVAALVEPGDHVVVEHPNYPSLYEVPRSLGCDVSLFTLTQEQAFMPDFAELERLVTPETKLISLTHASLSPRVISISSMSKSYGLPGIRIGWLATQAKEILASVLAIREQVTITNGAISEAVALSVLRRKDDFIKRAKQHVHANFQIVKSWMKQQDDLEWIPPQAGVVTLPRIKAEGISDPETVYRRLTEAYSSFVIPGRCFEMDNHYFRLGYGGTAEELETGLANITQTLEDVKLR
jgi:aspartate/methionine/tyrosine aminotransferase